MLHHGTMGPSRDGSAVPSHPIVFLGRNLVSFRPVVFLEDRTESRPIMPRRNASRRVGLRDQWSSRENSQGP